MTNLKGLIKISPRQNPQRSGDVIFVHGLDGDARSTWHPTGKKDDDNFWPAWLGEDFPNLDIWSLGYDVKSFAWKGNTMPLADRATNILAVLDTDDIGTHPLIFISHSMGGLLVKQMLRHAEDFNNPAWKRIVEQTKGIVFLSTPHSGANIASWIKHLKGILSTTISVDELEAHHSRLRELNTVYQKHERLNKIPVQAYCETKKTNGFLVVDQTSGDPNMPNAYLIPVDEDHLSICRPESKESSIYRRVKKFIQENIWKKKDEVNSRDNKNNGSQNIIINGVNHGGITNSGNIEQNLNFKKL